MCPVVHAATSVSVEMSGTKLLHQYSPPFRFLCPQVKVKQSEMTNISFSCPSNLSCLTCPLPFLHFAVLDVYVLSTDGQVQDFKFPQSSRDGISIQLSANTVKLNSRNGKLSCRVSAGPQKRLDFNVAKYFD